MPALRTIALLALALTSPALATDEGAAPSGRQRTQPAAGAAPWGGLQPLHARGPGAWFASAEAAAIDALTYARLQALESRDTTRIRGGTIYSVGSGYSYGPIRVANPLTPHRIRYRFGPHEVARFHAYPVYRDFRERFLESDESKADPSRVYPVRANRLVAGTVIGLAVWGALAAATSDA